MRDYPKGVKRIYDSGEKTFDRYTVYFSDRKAWGITDKITKGSILSSWPYVGMSEHPFHPQGFGQHGNGCLGKQNGKIIDFKDLPEDCKKLVLQDLK